MRNDRRLVYSTESGSLAKPMADTKRAKRRKEARQPAATPVRAGKQGVRIMRESKGRGGKTVTIITGLPLDDASLKKLLKQLKSQLGTGGAVKQGQLEIQGNHREKIMALLAKAGHPAKIAGG